MNNKEVYINGILVDLDEKDNPIQLTYAVNDLAELKDRQAYATNTFNIPYTSKNAAACGLPGDPNLIQLQPYRKNTARILQGGIEVMQNGIAIITKKSKGISVQILSGLIGFFDLLGDKSIRDLDLSEYDHTWDIATVTGSQLNTDGFIYPVIDYGGLFEADKIVDPRQLRPAIFRKTIIEKIISEAGYTAAGSYTAYPKYTTSLLPFSGDKLGHSDAYAELLKTYQFSARKTTNEVVNNKNIFNTIGFQDHATTDQYNAWNGIRYLAPATFRANVTLSYSLEQVRFFGNGSPTANLMHLQISKDGGANWQDLGTNHTENTQKGVIEYFLDQKITVTADIKQGDQIRVWDQQQPAADRMGTTIYAGSSIAVEPIAEDVVYGGAVQMAAALPDISQKDFFKDFLQNFGLIVIPDNYDKSLLLINMEDVYAQKPNATDITDKLIDTDDDIAFALNGYGINNYGKYKPDDAVTTGYGDGNMVLDNLTLDANVDLFQSVFAASLQVIKLGGVAVTQIRKIEDVTKSTEFTIKTENRILLNQTVNATVSFQDGVNTVSLNTISTPLFTGLEYQTLFEENYPEIRKMLYRPFAPVKQILLKEIDIKQITDWTVPVYDRKTASYYYKNLINYLQGDISTISLIRLP